MPEGAQVLHRGPVSHEEIPDWLSAADVFALPTYAEGSCNAILEAMACGLPIVSSNIPANREVLDPSFSVTVDPYDIRQIRQAIETLVDDPERREAMGRIASENARRYDSANRARGIFDWLKDIPTR